jgi:hypothetical protein
MSLLAQEAQKVWRAQCPLHDSVTGQVYYDPHFIGFNNQNFTLQPQTDAILFKNLSMGFEIHARHGAVNINPGSPTVVNALAIKVGAHKIQYNGTNRSILVDGQPPPFFNGGAIIGWVPDQSGNGGRADALIILINENTFEIYTFSGARLTVYNSRGYNLNVTLTLPRTVAQNAEPSLFGNLNGEHGRNIPATGIFS